uniref:Lipocalin n=1 Tax=Rhipicephalus zambeziensis TaxID=60191 RepID=A0A224YCG0_9ACAR
MQLMGMRNLPALIIVMLLTAIVTRTEVSEQAKAGEQNEQTENAGQKQSVDIAEFYATNETILILGGLTSTYPCMVDLIDVTSTTQTSFTRYYKEGERFQKKDLTGIFRGLGDNSTKFDRMTVTPRQERGSTAYPPPWNTEEAMVYESALKDCALFHVRPMQPSKTITRYQAQGRQSVRGARDLYDVRLKTSITQTQRGEQCIEELKTLIKAAPPNGQHVQMPDTLSNCKKQCTSDDTCHPVLAET